MSEKKVVSKGITIALVAVCIILAVGLVGAVANYTSIISEFINNKQFRIFTSVKQQPVSSHTYLIMKTRRWKFS